MNTIKLCLFFIMFSLLYGCDGSHLTSSSNKKMAELKPNIATVAQPNGSYTPPWDWTDQNNFKDYRGKSISDPWQLGSSVGVKIPYNYKCDPSDGWRLISYRMQASSYPNVVNPNETNGAHPEGVTPHTPYFVLYNKYSGTLRLFIYLGKSLNDGQTFILKTIILNRSNGKASDAGLLLNDVDHYSYPLSKKKKEFNKKRSIVTDKAEPGLWVIKDYHLSYEPNLSNPDKYSDLFFDVHAYSIRTENVNLDGKYNLKAKTIINGGSGGQSFIGALVNNIIGSTGSIKRSFNEVSNFKNNLNAIGDTLKGKNNFKFLKAVGSTLISVASAINPVSGLIGFTTGIAKYISSFTNIFGGGGSPKTALTYGHGSMHLQGHISNKTVVGWVQFGLPMVDYGGADIGIKWQHPIGLFSLKQTPQVKVTKKNFTYQCRENPSSPYSYYSTFGLFVQFDSQNMQNLFKINDKSDMILQNVKVVPIVKAALPFIGQMPSYIMIRENNVDLSGITYSSYYDIYGLFSNAFEDFMPPFALHGSSNPFLIEGVNPASFPKKLTLSGGYGGTRCINVTGGDVSGVQVKLRFYLKFVNRDNSNIKEEFMRTYKADVTKVTKRINR
jgi:hypothetical protein